MVGLDDLASLFQLQVREDAAARAITATYKNQTIVLTPDQSLVSSSGRLVSLPAPLTRRNNRWLVPVEFISRALAPIYDVRLDLPSGLAPARHRRSARAASHGAVRRQPVLAAGHVRDHAARDGDGDAGAGPVARAHRCRRARCLPSRSAAATVADRHSRRRAEHDPDGSRSSGSARSAPRRRSRAAPPRSSRSSCSPQAQTRPRIASAPGAARRTHRTWRTHRTRYAWRPSCFRRRDASHHPHDRDRSGTWRRRQRREGRRAARSRRT